MYPYMELELPFARHFSANAADVKVDRDDQVLENYKRSFQIDGEVASADVLRAELFHVRTDVENLTVYSQELTAINGDHAEAIKNTFEPEIETFRREVQRGRFSDQTLHILESLLVCKDVKSLMGTRSRLTEFMRSEFLSVMRDIKEKTVQQKLWILEFFVHTFALLGDIEA
ncbi:uncharacterized protein LOC110605096 [Manihot esculenta]|uniref:uncharacterized protein LOC110605096 n=1 Tax=Manihot esculenta TaxID=3983 RepID=UPI000B5D3C1A|nr:uncharacterized protein LOC110605096 [Manihot esculenta]